MKYTYKWLVLFFSLISAVPVTQAKNAWAFESVSPAIYQLDQPVQQIFSTQSLALPPPEGAKITAVNVQILPSASARIESQVCAQDFEHCMPVQDGRLYTKAFNHFDASTPFYLVQRVRAWDGAYRPIYIKVQLNLWWQ